MSLVSYAGIAFILRTMVLLWLNKNAIWCFVMYVNSRGWCCEVKNAPYGVIVLIGLYLELHPTKVPSGNLLQSHCDSLLEWLSIHKQIYKKIITLSLHVVARVPPEIDSHGFSALTSWALRWVRDCYVYVIWPQTTNQSSEVQTLFIYHKPFSWVLMTDLLPIF